MYHGRLRKAFSMLIRGGEETCVLAVTSISFSSFSSNCTVTLKQRARRERKAHKRASCGEKKDKKIKLIQL